MVVAMAGGAIDGLGWLEVEEGRGCARRWCGGGHDRDGDGGARR